MPTYQYACTSCAEQIEAVQRFTDDPLTVCPACGGGLRKVYLPVGIVFKGSGFYRTDSRNGAAKGGDSDKANGAADKKADKTDSKASQDGGSSSSDAKKPDAGKPAAAKPSQPAGASTSS